jgi:hypothetical protein
MSLYVSFFITSNKKWNLEGSYAFPKKPPRRSKIWRKKNLLWILQAASSSYELPALPPSPHVATPAKVSTAPWKKLYVTVNFLLYYYLYYFIIKKLLTNLLLRKDNFGK